MSLTIDSEAVVVTVGGTELPLAVVTSAVDALAPEVDACTITVPWGDRLIRGASDPIETLPALGSTVEISCGGWTWRGKLTRRSRIGAGSQRSISLMAHGPGLVLDRSYLPSFARVGLSGVIQTPGGPRFAPGTSGGDHLTAGGTDWTVASALETYVDQAVTVCELPAITVDSSGADLTRKLPDLDLDGVSVFAGISSILGHRTGLSFRAQDTASGWLLRVRGMGGSPVTVDLTGGRVISYDVGEDATATLASLEVRGARKVYVISIDSGGNLIVDWNSGDEAARAAGNRSSPAFRRFRLANFALPDGSPAITAEPVPTLPIATAETLAAGSSPWQLFAQLSSDSSWVALQGRVSIGIAGSIVWIEGIDPVEWATWSRIRLTLALSPRAHLTAVRTSGSGIGRGLVVIGTRHAVASSAAIGVSGGSLSTVTGTVVSDQQPVTDEADALWSTLGQPQGDATWTVEGVDESGPEPGDRIATFLLPVPGADPTTVAGDWVCNAVRRSWSDGRILTTREARPRPYATGAQTR